MNNEFFSTGRLTTYAVALLIGGAALPSLRDGSASAVWGRVSESAHHVHAPAPVTGRLAEGVDRARAITTRSRMQGNKTQLKLWARQHGQPKSRDFTEVLGEAATRDGWGRPMSFQPPTEGRAGWLYSRGPDGRQSKDDIFEMVYPRDLR